MLTAEVTLVSIGEAARLAGVSLQRYVETAESLGIKAAERRDGVPFIRGEHDAQIREYLNRPNREQS
jgi:hypothetical protein